jgi:1-acyl-sn-glycerol-3-phosphate acyltransferase
MFTKLKVLSEINNQLCNEETLNDICNNLIKYFHPNNEIKYYNLDEIYNLKNEKINNEKINKGFIILLNHTCITSDFLLILSKIDCYTTTSKRLFKKLLYFSKLTNDQMVDRCKLIEYQKKTDTTESNGEEVKNIILDKINNCNIVQLFPEGTMSGKNKLYDFKKGSIDLAFENNIPILPIIIDYKDDFYVNNESEPDRLVHHLEDTSGIDIHALKFIYPEDFDTFDKFYDKVYNTMNDFYMECKKSVL